MTISAENPLTYTGTNAAEFLGTVRHFGYRLVGEYPGAAHSPFTIGYRTHTHLIEEGDSVWPGASGYGLTVDKTVGTLRKIREAPEPEQTPEDALEEAVALYIAAKRPGVVDNNLRFIVAWETDGEGPNTYGAGTIRSEHCRPAEAIGLLQMGAAQRLGEGR